jgi:hypothetical protein
MRLLWTFKGVAAASDVEGALSSLTRARRSANRRKCAGAALKAVLHVFVVASEAATMAMERLSSMM